LPLARQFGVGLRVHRSPYGEMALDCAYRLRFIGSVGPPDLDHVFGDPIRDEAGALEVLAKVGDEPGVTKNSNRNEPGDLTGLPNATQGE
jgi:hypothetical protein